MCDPVTVGVALTAFSAVGQAKAQYDQGVYQNDVAKYNARILENQAQDVRNQGNQAENAHRQQVAQLVSKQRAQLAANGLSLDSGSALQLQDDATTLGEADALRIRGNYNSEVDAIKSKASLVRSEGKMALSAGKRNAAGSLLSSAGGMLGTGVADKWFTPNSAANTATTLNGSTATLKYGNLA